jgi:transposase-like protein
MALYSTSILYYIDIYMPKYVLQDTFRAVRDEAGNLGRPVTGVGYLKPELLELQEVSLPPEQPGEILGNPRLAEEVATRCLVWGPPLRVESEDMTSEALDDFTRVCTMTDEEILRVACKQGVLGLCAEHRKPFTHTKPSLEVPVPIWPSVCCPAEFERLSDWRSYSADALIILLVAEASVSGDERPRAELPEPLAKRWDKEVWLATLAGRKKQVDKKHLKQAFRDRAQGLVNNWLAMSGISLRCRGLEQIRGRHSSALTIGVEYSSLFDVIAVQLLLAVARADRLASCAECAMPFCRRLRIAAGKTVGFGERRIYCPSCDRKGVDTRNAVRSHRKRKAEAVRLYGDGLACKEIAQWLHEQALNPARSADAQTVERWIRDEMKKRKWR